MNEPTYYLCGASGWEPGIPQTSFKVESEVAQPFLGFTKFVALTGQEVRLANGQEEHHIGGTRVQREGTICELQPPGPILIVPIKLEGMGGTVGVIRAVRAFGADGFEDELMTLLRQEAEIRALLLRQRFRQRELIARLAGLDGSGTEDEFASALAEAAKLLVSDEGCESRLYLLKGGTYRRHGAPNVTLPTDRKSLTHAIIEKRQPVLSTNLAADTAEGGFLFEFSDKRERGDPGSLSFVGAPIVAEPPKMPAVTATIELRSRKWNAFFEHDKENLHALAQQAAKVLGRLRRWSTQKTTLDELVATADFCIISTEKGGRIGVFNGGASQLLNVSADEAHAKGVVDIVYGGCKDLAERVGKQLRRTDPLKDFVTVVYRRPEGAAENLSRHTMIPIPIKLTARRTSTGGSIGVFRPLFDLKLLAPRMREFGPADTDGVTVDSRMVALLERTKNLAKGAHKPCVLVLGESGTGKELIARYIHESSGRDARPGSFIAAQLALLAPSLIASELFGVEKGVATEVSARTGCFEKADKGSLILDEVATLPPEVQAGLLRVLQERMVRKVGGAHEYSVDVFVIAATNEETKLDDPTQFRHDLRKRMQSTLRLPPLRERRPDIVLLSARIMKRFVDERLDKKVLKQHQVPIGFDGAVLRAFLNHDWPGNVRGLQSVIDDALTFYCMRVESSPEADRFIEFDDLPLEFRNTLREAGDDMGELSSDSAVERRLSEIEGRLKRIEQRSRKSWKDWIATNLAHPVVVEWLKTGARQPLVKHLESVGYSEGIDKIKPTAVSNLKNKLEREAGRRAKPSADEERT